jgi:hypothetical protein
MNVMRHTNIITVSTAIAGGWRDTHFAPNSSGGLDASGIDGEGVTVAKFKSSSGVAEFLLQ